MTPILNTGFVSIHPWPCWERQVRVWHIEIRTSEEVLPAVLYAKQSGRIPEELGEFFYWLANKYADRKQFRNYRNCDDYIGTVILFLCSHTMKFNATVSSNPVGYFIQVTCHYFKRVIDKDIEHRKLLDKVKEEIDIQCLDHYCELYDCAY